MSDGETDTAAAAAAALRTSTSVVVEHSTWRQLFLAEAERHGVVFDEAHATATATTESFSWSGEPSLSRTEKPLALDRLDRRFDADDVDELPYGVLVCVETPERVYFACRRGTSAWVASMSLENYASGGGAATIPK